MAKKSDGKTYGVFVQPSGEPDLQNATHEEAWQHCRKRNASFGRGNRYDMFYVSAHDFVPNPFGTATPHTAPDAKWPNS